MGFALPPLPPEDDQPTISWSPFPGPQTEALRRNEDEVFFGGGRIGGKSATQIAWAGAPCVERDEKGRIKYPNMRVLMIRFRYNDLKSWIDDAHRIYRQHGAVQKDDPAEFHFPGGPVIRTGHLGGERAWERYQGWNAHKLGVDEVGQIPKFDTYYLMQGSIRGSPDGLSQTFVTGNPGNAGDIWVRKYFTRVKDSEGRLIPPGTTIVHPLSGTTRIYIQSTYRDNLWILKNDPNAIRRLEAIPSEAIRRAWLDADWDAFTGSYFDAFRPNGPMTHEPPEARHVLNVHDPRAQMEPWWFTWASLDWGYSHFSAAYKFRRDPRGQTHVYGELMRQRVGSFQLGIQIANWLLPELEQAPTGQVVLYISPDAMDQRRDAANTQAEQIEEGIKAVLGKNGAFLAKRTEEEEEIRKKDPEQALRMMQSRMEQTIGYRSIIIARANNNRVAGWNMCRDSMRFTRIDWARPDPSYVQELLKLNHGPRLAEEYLSRFKLEIEEILPPMVIHADCPYLIEWIPTAIHDPQEPEDVLKIEGDDPGDAWRYGMMALRDNEHALPRSIKLTERIAAVRADLIGRGLTLDDPTLKAHALMKIHHDMETEENAGLSGFSFSRGGVGPFIG